jgi:thioredoxin-related protein
MKYKILSVIFVCALFWGGISVAETPRDPYQHFFNETFGDFSEELENAREQGKKGVVIFFEMDECPFCHYMKGNVLNQPSVQDYYRKNFSLYSVDIEGDVEIVDFNGESMSQKDFAFKKHRVRATPVIAFFDLTGKRIHRHTGKTSGVKEFMLMGEFVADGHHEKLSFTRFKRSKKN